MDKDFLGTQYTYFVHTIKFDCIIEFGVSISGNYFKS